MKLTELATDGNHIEAAISLQRLHSGLNLIQSDRPGPLQSLWGLLTHALTYVPGTELSRTHNSSLSTASGGSDSRSLREWLGTGQVRGQIGDLVVRGRRGSGERPSWESWEPNATTGTWVPYRGEWLSWDFPGQAWLACWDFTQLRETWRERAGLWSQWFPELNHRSRFTSAAEYQEWRAAADNRLRLWEEARSRLVAAERERNQLQEQIEELRRQELWQRERVEQELASLELRLQGARQDVDRVRLLVADLDRQIEDLQALIRVRSQEVTRVATPPTTPSFLEGLYAQWDELTWQREAWLLLSEQIQAHRLRTRDEMLQWNELKLSEPTHPYYRIHELLEEIEPKLQAIDESARHWQTAEATPPSAALRIRDDVQQLHERFGEICDELGTQYKSLRHRAAVEELKQLRSHYQEAQARLAATAQRRSALEEELRRWDPAGVEWLQNPSEEFLRWVHQHGSLAARRKWGGPEPQLAAPEFRTVRVDVTSETAQLQDLQNRRLALRGDIARLDSVFHSLLQEKETWLERRRYSTTGDAAAWQRRWEQLQADERQWHQEVARLAPLIEEDRNVAPFREAPWMGRVQYWWQQLRGNSDRLHWSIADARWEIRREQGELLVGETADRSTQTQLLLALALATAEWHRGHGRAYPLVLWYPYANLDDESGQRVTRVLYEAGQGGLQSLVLTDRMVYDGRWQAQLPALSYGEFRIQTVPAVHTVITSNTSSTLPPPPAIVASSATVEDSRRALLNPAAPPNWRDLNQVVYAQPAAAPMVYSEAGIPSSPVASATWTWNDTPALAAPGLANLVATSSPATPGAHLSAITESTSLNNVDLVDSIHLANLRAGGISSISQLLDLDPEQLPAALISRGFTSAQLERWQAQAWLLLCVPGLLPSEARLLIACGILEPEQLEEVAPEQLTQRLNRYLGSPDGQRLLHGARQIEPSRLRAWYDGLRQARSGWSQPAGYSRRLRRRGSRLSPAAHPPTVKSLAVNTGQPRYFELPRSRAPEVGRYFNSGGTSVSPRGPASGEVDRESQPAVPMSRHDTVAAVGSEPRGARRESQSGNRERQTTFFPDRARTESPESEPRESRAAAAEVATGGTLPGNLKFYLNPEDPVEAAPSIGPKTAERFTAVGIHTIEDFLRVNAEAMAERINYKRLNAEVIRTWQEQTRLVCRVPNLRGHDAQLLVACGVSTPEALAGMNPRKLLSLVGPFSDTKEGLKIIRSGKKPDLEEVTDWIEWAKHTRPLKAAG